MVLELNAHEARVLGVLIEKSLSTPEHYPLSLNAATNGSNQKSNRDPVVDFSEAEVTVALQGLMYKHLAGSSQPAGSRVEKWRHNAAEHLALNDKDLAVLSELLVRGAQAPGQLRTRASRMRTFHNLEELSHSLNRLSDKGYVEMLAPAPGSRAACYRQTLARELHLDEDRLAQGPAAAPAAAPSTEAASPVAMSRPAAPAATQASLEERVARLERQLSELAEKLGEPLG